MLLQASANSSIKQNFSPLARKLLYLAVVTGLGLIATAARAGELDDLKAALKHQQDRIEQLEAKQAPTIATQATASTIAPTAPPISTIPATPQTGLQVKLYGRADIGYNVSIGANAAGTVITTRRMNEGLMVSRIGFSANYLFDPEFKALAGAEIGVDLFSGSAGGTTQNSTAGQVLFNRGATAGVASTRWGSLEGGTMYLATFWPALNADLASANGWGAADLSALFSLTRPDALGRYLKDPVTGNVSATTTQTGSNSGTALFYGNSVRYRMPQFTGGLKPFSIELSYSNGQQAASDTPLKDDGKALAFNLIYNDGRLFVGYGHMDYLQVNDIATVGSSVWATRHQVTDIIGARHTWGNLTLGGSYASYRVSNAGGYQAAAYGLSGGYDINKHRIESSLGRITYSGANAVGAYGTNTGDGMGDPATSSIALGYLYKLERNLTLYVYYTTMLNNDHAKLGVFQFRGDNDYFGYSPKQYALGMFFIF